MRHHLFLLVLLTFPAQAQDWDVNEPFGPTTDVSFTTTEGTWMSVDVSPDGETIVFDLLGDIYTIPISGGEATALTSGPAWDVQPAFSPDGSRIAYTSDRAGGDNIWVMSSDGSDARRITEENFRLLNGPAWTPDGQYILARKHFSSTRSLGAGEVWMYHASGQATAGIQLTERKNDQQDQGNEIALSPDGRYVYFSEDVSGGSTFEYNKDPNTRIYAVRRLDRETGDIRNYITGNGGSARPTPSPDGSRIAFVRRIRAHSVLHLFDTTTGREWPIYDGLDHDQQEAWAIFGVYPAMSWTPDGRSIVFWADGGINRIDVQSHEVTSIPFSVDVERTIHEALRFPVEVHPDRFESRMISDAATSPDGTMLVFHAAGYLYVKDLPDGSPRRLTSQREHWEYDPSFSSDGHSIVYTTWDDEDYASIRVIPATGGTSRRITSRPGHYFEPRFSNEGSMIVFRKGSGSQIIGRLHGLEPGIYRIPTAGGEETRVSEGGSDARFGPDDNRIYFLAGGGLSKTYRSVDLHGGDDRTHFTLKYATTVVPSPDFEWVAFNEAFNAYVAPFPLTGSPLDLNKDTRAIPIKQITRDLGTDLHWSGDSSTLYWMMGPEYVSRGLSESFTFVEGASASDPDDLPEADSTGTPVGLWLDSAKPSGSLAVVGARVVTMSGDEVLENATVLVEGNRIAAVGPRSEVSVPVGATIIDGTGKTLIPGLVDAHGHASHFFSAPMPETSWPYMANLAFGVTTMHDPSANTETVFTLGEMVLSGRIVGPRIFSTGTILYGADGTSRAVIKIQEDARSHLRRMKAVGAISVKSYNQPRRDQRQQIIQAAREYGIMVVPEGGSTFNHNLTMIVDGHTGIEHNIPVAPLYRDVMELWRHSGTGYTPTLVVNYGGPSGERFWYQTTNVWENERLLEWMPRENVDAISRRRVISPVEEYHHITVAEQAAKLVDQGNLVQMGAHGQLHGLAAHWETWMFEQGGMTPHEALRSSTLHGARYLGLDGDIGSIEVGKLADMVLIDGNPLEDLKQSQNVSDVILNGVRLDLAKN